MKNDDDTLNPFADPAVMAAQSENAEANTVPVGPSVTAGFPSYIPPSQPSPANIPWGIPNQATGPSQGQNGNSSNVFYEESGARARDIIARESELQRREADLEQREKQRLVESDGLKTNNFPPLPSFCCIKPCFYISIKEEIPVNYQGLVRLALYNVLMYIIVLLINMVGCFMYISLKFSGPVAHLLCGLFLGVLFIFTSIYFCFIVLYKALRNNSQFNFLLYFISAGVSVAIAIAQTVGAGQSGWCGMIVMAKAFDREKSEGGPSYGLGILSALCTLGFISFGLITAYTFYRTYKIYKEGNHPALVDQARVTFANQAVRGAMQTA